MPLIGLCGTKRHGKDSVADVLVRNFGFQKFSFAGPLKEVGRAMFRFTDRQLHGDEKEVVDSYWGVTPRQVLQVVGTELMGQLTTVLPDLKLEGERIWVRLMRRQLENLLADQRNIVITDVRFVDEAKFISECGGVIWRVDRPSLPACEDTHVSETSLEQLSPDDVLLNNGSLEDLDRKVSQLLVKHQGIMKWTARSFSFRKSPASLMEQSPAKKVKLSEALTAFMKDKEVVDKNI